ncbi:hypothetical protein ONZ45_g1188 [Pleurotus djamor]|nr:hypothetical protein ONZ45_g1188 [Pleurotus djamor]
MSSSMPQKITIKQVKIEDMFPKALLEESSRQIEESGILKDCKSFDEMMAKILSLPSKANPSGGRGSAPFLFFTPDANLGQPGGLSNLSGPLQCFDLSSAEQAAQAGKVLASARAAKAREASAPLVDPSTVISPNDVTVNDSCILTTLPESTDPAILIGGQTQCILLSARDKAHLVGAFGYPQAMPQPKLPLEDIFVIEEVPGKGLGMIAARDIKQGELICSERALLIVPGALLGDRTVNQPKAMNISKLKDNVLYYRKSIDAHEANIQKALERMSEEDREKFLALWDCHKEEGTTGPLYGRVRTNGFGVFASKEYPDGKIWYTGVYNNLSRMNHSCTPNTHMSASPSSLSYQCYASSPIRKGDEITTSYIGDRFASNLNAAEEKEERKRLLKGYGIACACDVCEGKPIVHKVKVDGLDGEVEVEVEMEKFGSLSM